MPHIPLEILQEVFKQCSSPLRPLIAHEFPWYLGHVCSQWRVLFFSMRSTFWNRIAIQLFYSGKERSASRIEEIVAFFLDRTCGRPFSFQLYISPAFTFDVQPILLDLVDHSEQWEEASIQLLAPKLEYLWRQGPSPAVEKTRHMGMDGQES
jgi:hypothetical protein